MHTTYQQDLFLASAPRKPYCADDLNSGVYIRSQQSALRHRHIQHNPPKKIAFLVFDFDRAGALVATQDAGLPEANWVTENRDTRRGHIAYALACPVITSDVARLKPMRFAASVEQGYRDALRADASYSNFLTKTPGHEDWHTKWGRFEPYTLEELAEWLPQGLPKVTPKKEQASGLGRNCRLFESMKVWSYRARLRFDDFNEWSDACLAQAQAINGAFPNPMAFNEVRNVAKSVAKWVWQRFNNETFSAIQHHRGRKGGRARGIQKSCERMDVSQQILEFSNA